MLLTRAANVKILPKEIQQNFGNLLQRKEIAKKKKKRKKKVFKCLILQFATLRTMELNLMEKIATVKFGILFYVSK